MEIFISVGVSEGGFTTDGADVEVGGAGVSVGEEAAVGSTWTEKRQASSNSVIKTMQMGNRNDLGTSIAFSLS